MKKIFAILTIGFLIFANIIEVSADSYGLDTAAGASGINKTKIGQDVNTIIGTVIGAGLSMIAVLFFILMIYGGFLWMTAHGNEDQVKKAQDTIIAASIGIILIMASYAITRFVFNSLKVGGENGPSCVNKLEADRTPSAECVDVDCTVLSVQKGCGNFPNCCEVK